MELAWPLTGVSIGVDMPSHATRRVFPVFSDQGTFVAKMSHATTSHRADTAQLLVLDYLAQRKFPHAPALLLTRNGDRAARVGLGVVWMVEYLPRAVDDSDSSMETWSLLIVLVAWDQAGTTAPAIVNESVGGEARHAGCTRLRRARCPERPTEPESPNIVTSRRSWAPATPDSACAYGRSHRGWTDEANRTLRQCTMTHPPTSATTTAATWAPSTMNRWSASGYRLMVTSGRPDRPCSQRTRSSGRA